MNDRAASADSPDGSSAGTVIYERRSNPLVAVLAILVGVVAAYVSVLDLSLSDWLAVFEGGTSGGALQDVLHRLTTRNVLIGGLLAMVPIAFELYGSLRADPRRVEVAGDRLEVRARRRTMALALSEIREVRATKPHLLGRGRRLTLELASGERVELEWDEDPHDKLLEALDTSLLLQPVPGDRSGLLRRPLLHPGEPILELVSGDRVCPRCEKRYPSEHWFVVHGPKRAWVCRPCAEALDLQGAEARLGQAGHGAALTGS